MYDKLLRNIDNFRRLQKGFKQIEKKKGGLTMQELKEKLEHALQNFNYADSKHVDAAIMGLNAAEEKLNIFMKEMKENEHRGSNKPTRRFANALSRFRGQGR